MKKILKLYRFWRYRRLFRKLLLLYTAKSESSDIAVSNALTAFAWLTGVEYRDLFKDPVFLALLDSPL